MASTHIPKEISLDKRKMTLLLILDKSTINLDRVREIAEKEEFNEKADFHITIIGNSYGRALVDHLVRISQEDREKIIKKIEKLAHAYDWKFKIKNEAYQLSEKYKIAQADGSEPIEDWKYSIITFISLSDLGLFYIQLNKIIKLDLVAPPAHITLFTKGKNAERSRVGIGLKSMHEFENFNPIKI